MIVILLLVFALSAEFTRAYTEGNWHVLTDPTFSVRLTPSPTNLHFSLPVSLVAKDGSTVTSNYMLLSTSSPSTIFFSNEMCASESWDAQPNIRLSCISEDDIYSKGSKETKYNTKENIDGQVRLFASSTNISSIPFLIVNSVASIDTSHQVQLFANSDKLELEDVSIVYSYTNLSVSPFSASLVNFSGVVGLTSSLSNLQDGYSSTPILKSIGMSSGYSSPPSFGLDLNISMVNDSFLNAPSSLYIDGIPLPYRSRIRWNDRLFSKSEPDFIDTVPSFEVLSVSICGMDVAKSPTKVVLDTSQSCLVLPTAIFSQVIQHSPIACDVISSSKQDTPACYFDYTSSVDGINTPHVLPFLSFSTGSSEFDVALERLLLPKGYDRVTSSSISQRTQFNRICMMPTDDNSITFGTLAMSQLYWHILPKKIGYASKALTLSSSSPQVGCFSNAMSTCVGQQSVYLGLNVCVEPDCSNYFLLIFDPLSHSCVWSWTLFLLSSLVLVLLTILVFFSYIAKRQIMKSVESSTVLLHLKPLYRGKRL